MVYLASGGFWLTVGQVVSSLSAFALAIAFANLVPPETYGTYKYLLSIAGMFAIFTLPGFSTAVSRATARGHASVIHAATRERIVFSLLGTLAAFGGAWYYFINGNMELSIALAIIGALLPVFDTFTTYNGYLTGKRNFKQQSLFHLISQSISTISLVATLFFTDSVIFLLLAYFVPLTIVRFALYKKVTARIDSGTPDKETLTYGKHLSFINVLGTVAGSIDKILLWKFLGPAQVAIYTFALAIPEQMKGPIKGVAELAFPKFVAQTPEQIRQNMHALWRKIAFYALGLLSISLVYILIAPYIFKFLFPQYMESVFYSQVFAISMITMVNPLLGSLLQAQKRTKMLYLVTIIHPTNIIMFSFIFIYLYGIIGAIIALILSRVIGTITIILVILYTFQKTPS